MSSALSLVYGTNIWTHHQVPVATELERIIGPERFRMALFENVHDERRNMGWGERGEYPWVLGPPRNEREMNLIIQQCLDADVMVLGACPMEILQARVNANKLTLVSAERLLKKPFHRLRMINPRYARGIMRYRALVNHPHVHALTIGHYAPEDLRTIGAFGDRIWRWGYFVDVNPAAPPVLQDQPVQLLWVGRMLDWKRVDTLLRVLARIQDSPWFGGCTIVGDGPERDSLLRLADQLGLDQGRMRFHPSVSFDEVRRMMRNSDAYILSSNRHEGWGAVAGEAMSEGCVLVANEQAGAARELIEDGATGFLYRDGNVDHLAELLERLAGDYPLRMKIRHEAWKRMHSLLHPQVAAERLVALCEGLLGKSAMPVYEEGPCSRSCKE